MERKLSVVSFSSPNFVFFSLPVPLSFSGLREEWWGRRVRLYFVPCALFTLWFCFEFCVSVLSFVFLFWVLWFCFEFCDSVLGFVILFWVLRFCFVPIYHRKNAFRELQQHRQTATDNLTLQMQHTSSSLPDYVGSWPRLFKRWIALPLG